MDKEIEKANSILNELKVQKGGVPYNSQRFRHLNDVVCLIFRNKQATFNIRTILQIDDLDALVRSIYEYDEPFNEKQYDLIVQKKIIEVNSFLKIYGLILIKCVRSSQYVVFKINVNKKVEMPLNEANIHSFSVFRIVENILDYYNSSRFL